MFTFSELILFGFFIIFAVICGLLIPILIKANKVMNTVHTLVDGNKDDIDSIIKHASNTTENVDTIIGSVEKKVVEIDKVADSLKVLATFLGGIIGKAGKSKDKKVDKDK